MRNQYLKSEFLLFLLFILSCTIFLNSCAKHEYIQVENFPQPPAITPGEKPKMISGYELSKRLRKQLPGLETLIILDENYIFMPKSWFAELKQWTEKFIQQQVPDLTAAKVHPVDYKKVFTAFMGSIANLTMAKQYNIKGSVLLGILVTRNVEPWGKIQATDEEMRYIVALAEEGGLVHDLETNQTVAFHSFPNLKHVTKLVF